MDYATWHKELFHSSKTGECHQYGDSCNVALAQAHEAEDRLRETLSH